MSDYYSYPRTSSALGLALPRAERAPRSWYSILFRLMFLGRCGVHTDVNILKIPVFAKGETFIITAEDATTLAYQLVERALGTVNEKD